MTSKIFDNKFFILRHDSILGICIRRNSDNIPLHMRSYEKIIINGINALLHSYIDYKMGAWEK